MFADHQNKRLCDVIFPGSHDGAITEGKAHTQTQNYEIGKQAKYGCRWFDIRIMYTSNGEESEPVAFHAPGGKLLGPKTHNKGQSNEYQTLKFGGTGMKLEDICLQAKRFVQLRGSEFLFLKFDKCQGGYDRIARKVYELLGDAGKISIPGNNLNVAPVSALRGKVIPLFPDSQMQGPLGRLGYVNFWKNLFKEGTYERYYRGLQYFGKFSNKANIWDSIKKQENKQLPRGLEKVKKGNMPIETMGMMYWTATSISPWNNIRERDNKLWENGNDARMGEIWESCVKKSMETKFEVTRHPADPTGDFGLASIKAFMPNIVTIDQVDLFRCKKIWDLNNSSPFDLQQAWKLAGSPSHTKATRSRSNAIDGNTIGSQP